MLLLWFVPLTRMTMIRFSGILRILPRTMAPAYPCHPLSRSLSTPSPAANPGVTVTVDGVSVTVPAGSTALQACEAAGVHVPRFCYHEALSVAGNCRMCLVEIEKSPKPQASCAFPVMPNMKIITNSDAVRKAREAVMEFLLANHPLDCPICDQGGECDLQDQAMVHGSDSSRFSEMKHSVEDKYVGPLVKTVMTRCIHCTRCVRFATEIAGVEDLGMTGRGINSEIGTYVEKLMKSELSGNVVDLCPVGALTSRPNAFTARPWELRGAESIDVLDAVGASIRIDIRGGELMRVVPRCNPEVNGDWLADKGRYAIDGLKRQRLDSPMIRNGSTFVKVDWKTAFDHIKNRISRVSGRDIYAVAGDQVCAESMVALRDLMHRLNSPNLDCRQDGASLSADLRSSYVFNSTLSAVENSDVILLVGTDPRFEAPLLNWRLRRAVIDGKARVGVIGPLSDLTYAVDHLGLGGEALTSIANGSHPFSALLLAAKRPAILIGMGALCRTDGSAILHAAKSLCPKTLVTPEWNGLNIVHTAAARVAGLDIGFVPDHDGRRLGDSDTAAKVVYLLGADEIDTKLIPKNAFVIYQGTHGDRGAMIADVILPGAAFTEKNATFVNMEGRVQHTVAAQRPHADSREDWSIIRALSEELGHTLPYDTKEGVRDRLSEISPTFANEDKVDREWCGVTSFNDAKLSISPTPFVRVMESYYMSCAISRSSPTMAKCLAEQGKKHKGFVVV